MQFQRPSQVSDQTLDDLIEQLAELRKVHKLRPSPYTQQQIRILKTLMFPLMYGMQQTPTKSLQEMLNSRVRMTPEQIRMLEKLDQMVIPMLQAFQLPPYARNPIARNLPPSEEIQTWSPWIEGAYLDGGVVKARPIGEIKGHTFEEALLSWAKSNPEHAPFLHIPDKGRPTYYGLGIFMTEEEARASYG